MGKKLAIVVCVCMLLGLAACGTQPEPSATETPQSTPESSATMQPKPQPTTQPVIGVEEEAKETSITLSKKFIDVVWGHDESFDVERYARELEEREIVGEAHVNEDGSVTFTVDSEKHRELLARLREELLDTSNGTMECVDRIETNEDCTEITMYVNKEKYEYGVNGPVAILEKQIEAIIYRAFSGTVETPMVMKIVDADTNELLKTVDGWPMEWD